MARGAAPGLRADNQPELRAETARQDIVTLRKSAAIGSPLAFLSARLRGYFDAVTLSFRIYIHESLTPEQALNRLVEHYKAWAVNMPGGRRKHESRANDPAFVFAVSLVFLSPSAAWFALAKS